MYIGTLVAHWWQVGLPLLTYWAINPKRLASIALLCHLANTMYILLHIYHSQTGCRTAGYCTSLRMSPLMTQTRCSKVILRPTNGALPCHRATVMLEPLPRTTTSQRWDNHTPRDRDIFNNPGLIWWSTAAACSAAHSHSHVHLGLWLTFITLFLIPSWTIDQFIEFCWCLPWRE